MPLYRVSLEIPLKTVGYLTLEVDAASDEEAREKALDEIELGVDTPFPVLVPPWDEVEQMEVTYPAWVNDVELLEEDE